jgi:hypothetical protein
MDPLTIKGTMKTPTINSDLEQGIIDIRGRSNPENANAFYKPILDWIDEYVKDPVDRTTVNLELEYFNTTSSKCILSLLRKLESSKDSTRDIIVNWYYEKDDLDERETGEFYEKMTELSFNYIGV